MEDQNNDPFAQGQEHILQLRDRIIKIETIINYHDKEFQNVKASLADLADTVERHQVVILARLDEYNRQSLDVTYEQYRENAEKGTALDTKITAVDKKFDGFVKKWRAVTLAVWLTVATMSSVVAWVMTTGQDLGFVDIRQPVKVLVQPQELPIVPE